MVQGVRTWPSGVWEAVIPRSQPSRENADSGESKEIEDVADVATFSSVGRAYADAVGGDVDEIAFHGRFGEE